jgi:hypothetical protein
MVTVTPTAIPYSTIVDSSQEALVTILKDDATIAAYTTNILDGIPTSLLRGTGFPYLIVHTPVVKEERYTQTRFKIMLDFRIQVFDKKESNLRPLIDAVRNCLKTYQSYERQYRLTNFTINSSDLSREFLPDEESTPVWVYTLNVEFRWVGT